MKGWFMLACYEIIYQGISQHSNEGGWQFQNLSISKQFLHSFDDIKEKLAKKGEWPNPLCCFSYNLAICFSSNTDICMHRPYVLCVLFTCTYVHISLPWFQLVSWAKPKNAVS